MDKLALIHRLNLPDVISLIIGDISQSSLRAAALTLNVQSVEQFMEAMRRIIFGVTEYERKNSNYHVSNKNKEMVSKGYGERGHVQ